MADEMTKRERALVDESYFWYRVMCAEGNALPRYFVLDEWKRDDLMDCIRRCRNAVDAVRLCVFTLASLKRSTSLAFSAQVQVDAGIFAADFFSQRADDAEWDFWCHTLRHPMGSPIEDTTVVNRAVS